MSRFMTTLAFAASAIAASSPNDYTFAVKVSNPAPANPNCHAPFDGSYVVSLHTGAGLGAAALNSTEYYTELPPAHIEGNDLVFDVQGFDAPGWPTQVEQYTGYKGFTELSISNALGSTGGRFYINETGIQWTSNNTTGTPVPDEEFGGWLACEGPLSRPTLYTKFNNYITKYPQSCETVDLVPVEVKRPN